MKTTIIKQIVRNPTLWAALCGWLTAQTIKMIIMLVKKRKMDFSILVSTGNMPSAHSAMVSALATMIGLLEGFYSPIFAIAFIFASIVMFDAQSVRKATGEQAKILNQIINELFVEHKLSETRLAELLGHTRLEVIFGMLTGIIIALIFYFFIT